MVIHNISLTRLLMIAIALMLGVFALKLGKLPPQIPLFYSRPAGDSQVVDLVLIFLLPFFLVVIVLLNRFLTRRYFGDSTFIRTLFDYVNIGAVVLITYIFFRITFLVS